MKRNLRVTLTSLSAIAIILTPFVSQTAFAKAYHEITKAHHEIPKVRSRKPAHLANDGTLDPSVYQVTNGYMIDSQYVPQMTFQNQATNDSAMWQRASHSLYVTAQTFNPSSSSNGTSLLTVKPGQPLYLFAYRDTANVSYKMTTWQVNSPDATLTKGTNGWVYGKYNTAEATFVATKPGIYTVQANDGTAYSVPMVIFVGLSQLVSVPSYVSSTWSGVAPFSLSTMNTPQVVSHGGVTYTPFPAIAGWIPVQGTTSTKLTSISVVLQPSSSSSKSWDYRIPVVDGHFSADLRSPFTGKVVVNLWPNYLKEMTRVTDKNLSSYPMPLSYYNVTVNTEAPDVLQTSLLASSQGDFNMSPQFVQVGETLLENSPSIQTAIAAVNNYVTESLIYNQQEATVNAKGQSPYYLYEDNLASWKSGTGICEDYATLAGSILQSIGIPVTSLGGFANSGWTKPPKKDPNASADAHAWLEAYTGSSWMVVDPTWNNEAQGTVNSMITNEFMTATDSLLATHLNDPTQTNAPITRH